MKAGAYEYLRELARVAGSGDRALPPTLVAAVQLEVSSLPPASRALELAADGRTNRQIAATLFLSEKTIESHLSRIFPKLGVRSRVELAGLMAREQ
jgi:DNA-binding NarL/FixJ family response regulator